MIYMSALLQAVPVPPTAPVIVSAGSQIPPQAVEMFESFLIAVVVIAIGIPLVRALSRRFIERAPAPNPSLPMDLTERLERIEQAVDAIAIEVERVAEAQRFATKVLSEQRDALRLPGEPR